MMLEVSGTTNDLFEAIKSLPDDERQCVVLRTNECDFPGLDEASIRSIVSGSRLTPDRMRVISDGDLLNGSLFLRRDLPSDNAPITTYALDVERFNYAMEFGAVLALDAISEFNTYARDFTTQIRKAFGVQSSANLYLTTAKKRSFGGHRDDHDFIAVQIDGSKNWNLEDTTGPRKPVALPEPDKLTSFVATRGTFLYVPRGFWHDPVADSDRSTHITCSISYPNWKDLAAYMVKTVEDDEFCNETRFEVDDYKRLLKEFYDWWQSTLDSVDRSSANW
jgi:hypothetical protein